MNIRESVDSYDRETTQYIVAFLDMLGTDRRMRQENDIQKLSLNKLHNLYTRAVELTEKEKGLKFLEGVELKMFSDNIIITKKYPIDLLGRKLAVYSILNLVSHFQCSAVGDSVGWLVRGGITIGKLFIDNMMVWGTALLRAYELENKVAVYPRVAIDSAIMPDILAHSELNDCVLRDFDGVHFLNYMSIWHFADEIVYDGFQLIKSDARKPDGSFSDRIEQNLFWHMNYINCELDRKDERKIKGCRLSLD